MRALDVKGNPMEGLGIRVAWTKDDGSVATKTLWTDAYGTARWTGPVGKSPFMRQRTVKVAATANLVTTRVSRWFYVTRRLEARTAGFRTRVSDDTVVAGQTANVVTRATDTQGRPVSRLLVSWTWTAGGTTIAKDERLHRRRGPGALDAADHGRHDPRHDHRHGADERREHQPVGERHAQARGLNRRAGR